jgi:predicted O-linked N-acetylglucosamine transferase (SPINDLY family)
MGLLDWLNARRMRIESAGQQAPLAAPAAAGPLQLYRAGRRDEAAQAAGAALALDEGHTEGLMVQALLAQDGGQHARAAEGFERIVGVQPAHIDAWVGLGRARAAAGRRPAALAALEKAREIDARHPGLLAELALLAVAGGDVAGAQELLAKARAQGDSRLAQAHFQVARALLGQSNTRDAAVHLRLAVAGDDSHAAAHADLGAVLRDLGNTDQAARHLERALQLQQDLPLAAYNLALLRIDARRWGDAIGLLQQYLATAPSDADAHYWLGNAAMGLGDAALARKHYTGALRADARHVQARWGQVMAQIQAVHKDAGGQSQAITAFSAQLDKAAAWFRANPRDGFRAVGAQQPYYLAYVAQDHRQLLGRYGTLCASLMGAWARKVGVPAPAAAGARARLKVGIVSAHIHSHSVWHALLRGWVEHLDARRFELHLFHTGAARDQETQWAARHASLHYALGDWTAWAKALSDGRFDVLLYPEIGMDPTTVRLSALRLARVQLAGWGHPITTGLPTMDGYISAQGFEPEQAASHYTERLLALPRLGCAYRPYGTRPAQVDRAAWDIAPQDHLLLCPGQVFKYAPQDDALWIDIARRCQPCKLVFFRQQGDPLADLLEQRLRDAFAAAGMDFGQSVRFIPWQSQEGFFGLLHEADLMLDSVGFSGFNTAMQAVECGTPIVAWEGGQMRARFASAILQALELDQWVARSPQEFAALAQRLCADPGLRRQVRDHIMAHRTRLYDDRATVEALGQQLLALAGQP